MHIIESGEVAKTLATLTPLTNLSQNDAYYSTYWDRRKLEALYKRECAKIRREREQVTMQ